MSSNLSIRVKRAYAPASQEDGTRVLVDRLWPRGLRKDEAAIDHWLKEIAPSADLRRRFGHVPERWDDFHQRYSAELHEHAERLEELRALAAEKPLTLLFAAHDEAHNNAVVLRDVLLEG